MTDRNESTELGWYDLPGGAEEAVTIRHTAEVTRQPTPFDQDLYDRVIAEMPDLPKRHDDLLLGRSYGFQDAANAAARIAADRAATRQSLTDEALGEIVWSAMLSGGPPPSGALTFGQVSPSARAACIAAGVAVREALTAAPGNALEVPEGWVLWQIVHKYEGGYAAVICSGVMGEPGFTQVSGHGETWQAALAKAIAKAKGEIDG